MRVAYHPTSVTLSVQATPVPVVSARFHAALAAAALALAARAGESRVLLSGGCFQNRALTEGCLQALRAGGFEAYWHRQVPPNDGGLALGQVWAALRAPRGAEEEAVMCLAVPGKVLSVLGDDPIARSGRVDFSGIVKEVNLAFVPEAKVGDYVLVHVGLAIATIDEEEARHTLDALRQIEALDQELQ